MLVKGHLEYRTALAEVASGNKLQQTNTQDGYSMFFFFFFFFFSSLLSLFINALIIISIVIVFIILCS